MNVSPQDLIPAGKKLPALSGITKARARRPTPYPGLRRLWPPGLCALCGITFNTDSVKPSSMYLGTFADPRGAVEQEMFYAREKGFDFVELSLEGPKTTLEQLAPRTGGAEPAAGRAGHLLHLPHALGLEHRQPVQKDPRRHGAAGDRCDRLRRADRGPAGHRAHAHTVRADRQERS